MYTRNSIQPKLESNLQPEPIDPNQSNDVMECKDTLTARLKQVRKSVVFVILGVFIVFALALGFQHIVQQDILITYAKNQAALESAGLVNVIETPKVVSSKMIVWLTLFPVCLAAIMLPIVAYLLYVARMIQHDLSELTDKIGQLHDKCPMMPKRKRRRRNQD